MLQVETSPRRAPTEVFWGETAPIEHSVQIYDDSAIFMDTLEGFASGGLRANESVIIIASALHRKALERRLRARGHDVALAGAEDRYIVIDAEAALARIMVDGWPDEGRFEGLVSSLVDRARASRRRVRIFGEMVAILMQQGNNAATVQLEHLWSQYLEQNALCIFCAYPRSSFAAGAADALEAICSHHSRLIPD